MKKFLWLSCILLLSVCAAHAQSIFVVGVNKPETCVFATKPLVQDLQGVGFPKDWKFAVACTNTAWEELRRKGDAFGTNTAFTNVKGHITVLNGMIYTEPLPLKGTTHRTPKIVLEHELGHVLCGCDGEAKADKMAGLR